MGDDEGWIDFALLDALHKLRHVMLDGGLGHPEGEAAINGAAHRNLVQIPAIDADDRNRAEISAALDRLSKNVRPVRSHEGRDLDPVDHRANAGSGFRLGANGVDAGIRAAPAGQLLDAIVDVVVLEIECDCTRLSGECQPFRNGIDR